MTKKIPTSPFPLWLILALYLLLGAATSLIVPLGEAPDEVDHFLYMQYLAQERQFPILHAAAADNATMEANQPPLFYLLGALLISPVEMPETAEFPLNACYSFDPLDNGRQTFYLHTPAEQFPYTGTFLAFHLARLLSVGMGAITVWLVYRLGRQIAPTHPYIGLLAAALLAFNPQFIFITASVNNDVPTALFGAAILALSLHTAAHPTQRWLPVLLGCVVGLGLLTKFALFAFWPLAWLAAVWSVRPRSGRDVVRSGFLVIILPMLVAGWWYWRGWQLYGDPLAWQLHLQTKGAQVLRTTPLTLADFGQFVELHFQSYWALFGWLNVQVPAWVYANLAFLTVAAVAGLFVEGKERQIAKQWRTHLPLLLNGLAVVAIYASLFRYIQTINWSGYQGRLAYAAAGPLAVLLAVGLARWVRHSSVGKWLVPVGMAGLAIGSLFFVLLPAYARPAVYQSAPPEGQVCARFEGGLMLEGYELPEQVVAGQETAVSLYGYALFAADAPQTVVVQLLGRDGLVVGQGAAEWQWQKGEAISLTLPIHIANDAQPTRAVWQTGLQTNSGAWQMATSANGRILDIPLDLQTSKIAPERPFLPTPQQAASANFADQLQLIGYDTAPGGSITLYWQALAAIPTDYTTFVHLLDANGQLVTQADGQPQEGQYPTSIWGVGEIVADAKLLLPAPANNPPYRLAAGVYELASGVRLAVAGETADFAVLATCGTLAECLP